MKRYQIHGSFLLFFLFLFVGEFRVYAQESVEVHINENGIQQEDTIMLPTGMTYLEDSLLSDWHARNYLTAAQECSALPSNTVFPDSVYIERLSRMPVVMEMPYNEVVREFIDQYTGKLREQVSIMLGACNFYMPLFEEALDAYGLPLELKYLPIIESALRPTAVSRAGAAGLWQFMLRTGKLYGLETNSLVDERRDPIKSTWAAARYLKDMYDIYHDWNLVIAAYNCGPGNVNKAIRRADGKTDYWAIYRYLPRETRGYVPAFIAANYAMTYYCKHGICPMQTDMPAVTDTLQVNQRLHFQQIAAVCGVSMEQLAGLNPQYKQQIIPGDTKPQTLRLPLEYISVFIDNQDSVYAYRRDELFKNRRTVAVSTQAKAGSGKLTYHLIRQGETLGGIARKYGVTVRKLREWNGLRNNNIRAGRKLKIYR